MVRARGQIIRLTAIRVFRVHLPLIGVKCFFRCSNGIGAEDFAPLTLNFASAEEARQIPGQVINHRNIPVHSLTLVSEDGTVAERRFQIDGAWRRKAASPAAPNC
jgi:hypothetical protein